MYRSYPFCLYLRCCYDIPNFMFMLLAHTVRAPQDVCFVSRNNPVLILVMGPFLLTKTLVVLLPVSQAAYYCDVIPGS